MFADIKLKKHSDKTYIGRIEAESDFLGYHFWQAPLQIAQQTVGPSESTLNACYDFMSNRPRKRPPFPRWPWRGSLRETLDCNLSQVSARSTSGGS